MVCRLALIIRGFSGNAPNTWNISPTYDRGRFSIRVGISYNQANIFSYEFQDGTGGSGSNTGGSKGPFGDLYFYSHTQIDAQGSIRLGHGLSFIAYGLHLSDEVFGFYEGRSLMITANLTATYAPVSGGIQLPHRNEKRTSAHNWRLGRNSRRCCSRSSSESPWKAG